MKRSFSTVNEYISSLEENRKEIINQLRKVINDNIPEGFQECINYNMIGWVVPHEVYPDGYHCSPELPLPFMNLASQKNYIALYHMGIYSNPELLDWFKNEYTSRCSHKLDMGKSCIRFKKMDQIPNDLIGELVQKMDHKKWIELYEKAIKK